VEVKLMEYVKTLCPNCGEKMEEEYVDKCDTCKFSFSSVLICPQKDENNICNKTGNKCNVNKLDYEGCPFLHGANE
jgi:predicted RNA-binding Zn-ribbon protein involved in translation (DUF1610 family)